MSAVIALGVLTAGGFQLVPCDASLVASTGQLSPLQDDEGVLADHVIGEIGRAMGAGRTHGMENTKAAEDFLKPMFDTLPKNEHGKLAHGAVFYALSQYFARVRGWVFRGLGEHSGEYWNSSAAGIVRKERVPAFVHGVIDEFLGGRGLSLSQTAAMAATLENLVVDDLTEKLKGAYAVHGSGIENVVDPAEAADILETHVAASILGVSPTASSISEVSRAFPFWNETQQLIRRALPIKQTNLRSERLAFSGVVSAMKSVEHFRGVAHRAQCTRLKGRLLGLDEFENGNVWFVDFHADAGKGTDWQLSESLERLREFEVLDELSSLGPRVLVPNYLRSPTNCEGSSGFHSFCCIVDECERLRVRLETKVQKPSAEPSLLESVLREDLERKEMPISQISKLELLSVQHGGSVPLHGRDLLQWLHEAFPRMCPRPLARGMIAAYAPETLLEIASPSSEEKPWMREEEIVSTRRLAHGKMAFADTRNSVLRTVMLAVAVFCASVALLRTVLSAIKEESLI